MFRLLRFFSITSGIAFIIVTILLGVLFRQFAIDDLIKLQESKNVELTQAFSNSMWPRFAPFVHSVAGVSAEELRRRPEIAAFRDAVLEQMQGLSVVKVKIYNLDGLTVFSTQEDQIGEDKRENVGYLSAKSGGVASELTHRDTFSAFEGTIEDRDVISSYVPIRSHRPGTAVEGVFELYSDVTPLLRQVKKTQESLVIGVMIVLSALFIILFFAVRLGDRVMYGQYLAQEQAKEDLRESEERYALAAHGSNDGLWDWNIDTQEIYFSDRWYEMLGIAEQDINVQDRATWFDRVHPEDIEQLKESVTAHLERQAPHLQNEHRMFTEDGTYKWMQVRGLAIRDEKGHAYRIAGSLTDISRQKKTQEQLLHDAFHDTLTSLPNRALFMDHLAGAMQHKKRRENYLFAVLFIDLDHFKIVNDSLGHTLGDQLLVAIARSLEPMVRSGDTVARLGGDEFVVLLDDVNDINEVTRLTQRILQRLTTSFRLGGSEVFTTASVGITLSSNHYEHPEDMLRDADIAMYKAKSTGRGRYQVFDTAMHEHVVTRMQLETDLRRAVEREEFRVFYQPIYSLKNGVLAGVEALVRWQHPIRGLISPGEFLDAAEETGLLVSIDLFVLREACQQLNLWHEHFPTQAPLSVSVNLSGGHFNDMDLVDQIDRVLVETGLDPNRLALEITENVLFNKMGPAAALLSQLRSRGIQLYLDDFGTGYSSLSHLYNYRVHTIKIDRSFVARLSENDGAFRIVQAVAQLGQSLGIEVIAEGVKTQAQLKSLSALGCEYGQGNYFSMPCSNGEIEKLLMSTPSEVAV